MKSKWSLVAFLCAIFVVYTIDRALLGILAVPIQQETGIDNVRFGLLSAAVFWTYSVCVPFSGMLGDRLNRAKLIGFAVCLWSLMAILGGFAGGFWTLLIFVSVAICIPQTLYGPSASALIAEYHQETRTLALSCYQAAYYTGWFLSGAAVAGVLSFFGSWRAAYFVFGGVGLILGAAFLRWSYHAGTRAPIGDSTMGRCVPTSPKIKQSLFAFFGCKTALLCAVCYVAQVFIGYGYSAWGPKFIAQKFSLSPSVAGTGVMFSHYAAAFVAILIAGALTDRIVKHHPRSRLLMSTAALILSIPALVVFGKAQTLPLVWLSAAWLGAMIGVIGANQFTMLFDVVPSRFRSGSIGFLNVIAGLVGSTAPIILGSLSQNRGVVGFEIGFASLALVELIAIAALVAALFTFRNVHKVE